MTNKNKINTIKVLTGENLPSIVVGILIFLAFPGLYYLSCIILSLWGFPESPIEYPTMLGKFIHRLSHIGILLFSFVIIISFKKVQFRSFVGLSIPLIIFCIFALYRDCVDNYYFGKRPILGMIFQTYFYIHILVFSIPFRKENYWKGLWYYIIPVLIFDLILVVSWYDYILGGYTARNINVINSPHNWVGTFFSIVNEITYKPGFSGTILGIVLLWGWWAKKIRIEFALFGYIVGTILLYFSSSRGYFLAWLVTHIFMFVFMNMWKRKMAFWVVPLLITINCISFYYIGNSNQQNIASRLSLTTTKINYFSEKLRTGNDTSAPSEKPIEPTPGLSAESVNPSIKNKFYDFIDTHIGIDSHLIVKNPREVKKARNVTEKDYLILIKGDRNIEIRYVLWILTLRQIIENPFTGYSHWMYVNINGEYVRIDPHNTILRTFLETGIIGGFCFLFIVIRCFCDSVIVLRHNDECGWLACIFVFTFIGYLFAYHFRDPHIMIPIVALRAYVKSTYSNKKSLIENTPDN